MKKTGFVLVTVLSVAVLVLILGLGVSFSASSNLNIASNLRGNTEARYAADAGLEQTIIALRNDWNTTTVPSASLGNYTYQITITALDTQRRIESRATGPKGASHTSVGILDQQPNPAFGKGMVSQAQVRTASATTLTLQGDLHGNQGFALLGSSSISGKVTASEGATCSEQTISYCSNFSGFPQNLAQTQNLGVPNYTALKNANLPTKTTPITPPRSGTDYVIKTQADADFWFPAGSSVRLSGGALVIQGSVTLKNVSIVVEGYPIRFSNTTASNFQNCKFFASGFNFKATPSLENTALFADGSLNLVSGGDGLINALPGNVTIASGGNINFGAGKSTASGQPRVGLSVIAAGNITHKSSVALDVTYWAGGTTTLDGSGAIRGGIYSVGNIEVIRNTKVTGGVDSSNPDLPTVALILSRK